MNQTKKQKIAYWVSTGICCAIMLFSACLYFLKYDIIADYFPKMGYPAYLVYPLAIAKILGIVAILSNKFKLLKEWAYAGFFFDGILAFTVHMKSKDDGELLSIILIIAIIFSRYFWGKIETEKQLN
jgi:DoxX-like family